MVPRIFCVGVLLLVLVGGVAPAFADSACPATQASSPQPAQVDNCRRSAPPVRQVPPRAVQQHDTVSQSTYVYCGPAGAASATSSAGSASAAGSGPKIADASSSPGSAAAPCQNRVELKLSKDFGLSFQTGDSGLSWFAWIAIVVLALLALGLGAFAVNRSADSGSDGSGSLLIGLFALVAALLLGVVVGYSFKSEVHATLDERQIKELGASEAFRSEAIARAAEEALRLQQRVHELERDLAKAQIEASIAKESRANSVSSNSFLPYAVLITLFAVAGAATLLLDRWRSERPAEPTAGLLAIMSAVRELLADTTEDRDREGDRTHAIAIARRMLDGALDPRWRHRPSL